MMKGLTTVYKYLKFWGGSTHKCNVCNTRVKMFFPFSSELQQSAKSNGFAYDFRRMETLNFEQCNCPFCLSSDRERLYLIFLEKHFGEKGDGRSILDFAPTPAFSRRLRKFTNDYTSTDLTRDDVDIKMDVCDMKEMKKNSFDFIICSHVLEHVSDPDKALREIHRIMRPDAKAIIMVPLFWDVKVTVEDPGHTKKELRLRHYGQDDHVRLFSREDFLSRLKNADFKVEQLHTTDFDQKRIKENAIAENSVLYVCSKNV